MEGFTLSNGRAVDPLSDETSTPRVLLHEISTQENEFTSVRYASFVWLRFDLPLILIEVAFPRYDERKYFTNRSVHVRVAGTSSLCSLQQAR